MMRHMRMLPVFLLAGVALVLAAAALVSCSSDANSQVIQIPFDDAELFIEINSTDGDAGIQVFVDGEGWERLVIKDPSGKQLLVINGTTSVKAQGLTELFFESAEPSFDEQTLGELLALFPEGEYEFEGVTTEGDQLVATAELTHDLPAGPQIVGVAVNGNNVVISWELVEDSFADPDAPIRVIEIDSYQVVVEFEDLDFSIVLPGDATSVTVPPEFIANVSPNTEVKFEILAKEESGNQTITESSFTTE